MRVILLACTVLLPTFAAANETSRFTGGGTLVDGHAASADGRFAVEAEFRHVDKPTPVGRFTLMKAGLVTRDPSPSGAAVCGTGDDLFRNGFE